MASHARDRWHAIDHWKTHWIVNIAIGFSIDFLLSFAGDHGLAIGMKNWAMDAAMRGNAAIESSVARGAPPVTMIDIDEETWRSPEWGNGPYRAARAPLLNLISYATGSGARVVLVDVTIEAPNDNEDEVFKTGIQQLVPSLKPEQHILFMKTARRPLVFADRLAPVWQPSILDPIVSASHGKLDYAAPYFEVSTDGVVRSWLLWRAGCQPDSNDVVANNTGLGRWTVIPSVQLAVYRLEHGRPAQTSTKPGGVCLTGPEGIGKEPEESPDSDWRRETAHLFGNEAESGIDEPKINGIPRFDPSSRILYQERYPPQAAGISVLSALKVLQHDAHVPANLSGRIVVIGQSSDSARDWHSTPLGAMPGSMIIANALQSLLTFGPIRELPKYLEMLSSIVLIVVVGLVFARADSWVGGVLILVTFVPLLILLNLAVLRSGYWFEFSTPLLAMYVHRIVSNFEEYLVYRKWRQAHEADHSATHHSG
ncbi:CHASE2 domain-containing protein [Paraburkholderia xenovorans]|uniref:CHASE2 domain-containing protein n=1 Tax=Paraburkholderia xenovorans TaxID=36873 RepID=UPI0038BCF892